MHSKSISSTISRSDIPVGFCVYHCPFLSQSSGQDIQLIYHFKNWQNFVVDKELGLKFLRVGGNHFYFKIDPFANLDNHVCPLAPFSGIIQKGADFHVCQL